MECTLYNWGTEIIWDESWTYFVNIILRSYLLQVSHGSVSPHILFQILNPWFAVRAWRKIWTGVIQSLRPWSHKDQCVLQKIVPSCSNFPLMKECQNLKLWQIFTCTTYFPSQIVSKLWPDIVKTRWINSIKDPLGVRSVVNQWYFVMAIFHTNLSMIKSELGYLMSIFLSDLFHKFHRFTCH